MSRSALASTNHSSPSRQSSSWRGQAPPAAGTTAWVDQQHVCRSARETGPCSTPTVGRAPAYTAHRTLLHSLFCDHDRHARGPPFTSGTAVHQRHGRRQDIQVSAPSRRAIGVSWLTRHRGSLDVVQQPIRARMCGFGDKVRCVYVRCHEPASRRLSQR